MAISHTIQQYMVKHSVDYDLMMHKQSGCSHETAMAAQIPEDHLAKAVILKDQKGYAMIVVPANNWVNLKHLKKTLKRDFHLAKEDEIARLFSDCDPGAVPPIGPAYGIETYVDESLMELGSVYFESGDHQELVHTQGSDFQELMREAQYGNFSHFH